MRKLSSNGLQQTSKTFRNIRKQLGNFIQTQSTTEMHSMQSMLCLAKVPLRDPESGRLCRCAGIFALALRQ
jgi:hypothetical protein